MLGVHACAKLELCKEVQMEGLMFSNQCKKTSMGLLILGATRGNIVVVENHICMRFTHFLVFACKIMIKISQMFLHVQW